MPTYKLKTITPVSDTYAIFIEDYGDKKHKLISYLIEAIGLASESGEQQDLVVGLKSEDGWYQIQNEYGNFAGLCKRGEDITKCVSESIIRINQKPTFAGEE